MHPAVQTIEQTSKRWKLLQAASALALLLGILLVFGTEDDSGWGWVGAGLALLGIVGHFGARLGAWWENG